MSTERTLEKICKKMEQKHLPNKKIYQNIFEENILPKQLLKRTFHPGKMWRDISPKKGKTTSPENLWAETFTKKGLFFFTWFVGKCWGNFWHQNFSTEMSTLPNSLPWEIYAEKRKGPTKNLRKKKSADKPLQSNLQKASLEVLGRDLFSEIYWIFLWRDSC